MIQAFTRRMRGLVNLFWREVAKFGVVGGLAFIVDSAIFLWLVSGPMRGSEVWAKALATVVASIFSWVANRHWTFRHRKQANVVREAVLFAVMNFIGLLIASGCVWVAKYLMGLDDKFSLFIAGSVVGLILGTIFRFFAYRFWVFNVELDAEPGFDHDHELIEAEPGHGEALSATDQSILNEQHILDCQRRQNRSGSGSVTDTVPPARGEK